MRLEIGRVEDSVWYIDKAFRRANQRVSLTKVNPSLKLVDKIKHLETVRLHVVRDALHGDIAKLLSVFPRVSELDDFYRELFACFIDVDAYKKSLGSLKWAGERVVSITKTQERALHRATTAQEVASVRSMFLARCSSIFDQIASSFTLLEGCRKRIKDMPSLKPGLFTVAIAGFPNVGKSTLLSKITESKPEINSYAFTTKGLMIGNIIHQGRKVQIIDTPGTLNRFEKMNKIEKMAHLALKYVADVIVYVFDFTEPYDITQQLSLYQDIKQHNKQMLVYFSKHDLINTSLIDGFEVKGTYDPHILKQQILEKVPEKEEEN